jgi:hypothetical protein
MRVSRALLTIVQLSVWKSDTSGIRSTKYRPVSLQAAREIWRARPKETAIDALLKRDRRVRFDYVRTEGKLLASLLRGWAMIAPQNLPAISPEGNPGYSCL